MMAATKTKRATKLDRLLAQGEWVAVQIEGGSAPCRFVMPTEELQSELEKELEKKIRKHLRDCGFERICATRREHPFHSELLRERIDALASRFDPRINSEEGLASLRKEYDAMVGDPELTFQSVPFTQDDADWLLEKHIKDALAAWTSAFEDYRDMRKNAWYWRGTKAYNTVFPSDGPALPDGPRPKPVYVNKERPEIVLSLQDGCVNLYTRVKA
jgi:hypothetical protein